MGKEEEFPLRPSEVNAEEQLRFAAEHRISAPDSEIRFHALDRKLTEYKARISFVPSRESIWRFVDAYKLLILQQVLDSSSFEVNYQEALDRIKARAGENFEIELFNRAWLVVKDYVKTGGKDVEGGTGISALPL